MTDLAINLEDYKTVIQHDKDRNGFVETSARQAYLLDGGFYSKLQFQHKNCLKLVDYVKIREAEDKSEVYLIELTDLQDDMRNCIECEQLLFDKSTDVHSYIKSLDKKALKNTQKKLWHEIVEEIKGKWMGSIACYERLLRFNNIHGKSQPVYRLMIVLKDTTDPKELDLFKIELQKKLAGMMGIVAIITTQEL